MTAQEISPSKVIDIEDLALDRGAHLLLKRALAELPVGGRLGVQGRAVDLAVQLRGWARAQGHGFLAAQPGNSANHSSPLVAWLVRGTTPDVRRQQAETTGWSDATRAGAVLEQPRGNWGFAARGAAVEAGGPEFYYRLNTKTEVWAENAPKLYAQAAAAQWNPATAINWDTEFALAPEIERAVAQVMTYLIENENAALQVPARFVAQIHPHFREVLQLLAVQIADEARHIEVFTRRATLRGHELGLSTVGGQQSLRTLLDEPDFALSSFLLAVLGEGTFLHLLGFLEAHGPDTVTRQIARLVVQDEARHVAFGVSHLQYHAAREASLRDRLAQAITRRHDALALTAGLNEEVFDALVLLAAGSWQPHDIAAGFTKVQTLTAEMHAGRRSRLIKLGFTPVEAEQLSALHTRNFM